MHSRIKINICEFRFVDFEYYSKVKIGSFGFVYRHLIIVICSFCTGRELNVYASTFRCSSMYTIYRYVSSRVFWVSSNVLESKNVSSSTLVTHSFYTNRDQCVFSSLTYQFSTIVHL